MTNQSLHDILGRYDEIRSQQLDLCNRLEAIADSLPDRVDTAACMLLARSVGPLLRKAHQVEEEELFPVLSAMQREVPECADTLEQLKLDHIGDSYFSEEISEALYALAQGHPQHSPDATGYLLRCFFDGMRRHLTLESRLVAILSRIAEDPQHRAVH